VAAVKSVDDHVELVMVSYHRDLDQCIQLIESIRVDGFIDRNININVVVNDSQDVYAQHVSKLAHINNITVYHGANFGISHTRGWLSQQWLKLAIANVIKTPWYIIIDSDQCLWPGSAPVTWDHWFTQEQNNIKAYYKTLNFQEVVDKKLPFEKLWKNAAYHWQVDTNQFGAGLLSETPPVAMHTETVQRMLNYCDKSLFRKHDLVHEFGLYWTYLIKENLIDQLYVPFETLDKTNLLRHGRPCP
jgi:Family of unknown function (DUF6492)